MPFVIDSSVVSGWYLQDQATPYTEHVATRLAEDRAGAPALWELELTNVQRTSCLRLRLTAEKAQQILAHIARLPIDTDRHAVPRHELRALALRFGLSTTTPSILNWRCAVSCRWPRWPRRWLPGWAASKRRNAWAWRALPRDHGPESA